MVIERLSFLKLIEVEPKLRDAAQRMGASLCRRDSLDGGAVFTVVHQLDKKLLSSDVRFAAFLPCRIAAVEYRGGLKLVAMSPSRFAEELHNPELDSDAAALENLLNEILIDLQQLPSTEDQVDMQATVPPRVDSEGSKIEDQAGTGKQDSPGG
jgi:hypothetical protein